MLSVSRCVFTGDTHIKEMKECQDYADYTVHDDMVIIAVADGVGSAKYSSIGAKCNVDSVLDFFRKNKSDIVFEKSTDILSAELKESCTERLYQKIGLFQHDSSNDMDYSATILFCVISEEKKRFITGQIGDGMICVKEKGNAIKTITENISYLDNKNTPDILLTGNFEIHSEDISENFVGIVLMTDGISDVIYSLEQETIFTKNINNIFDILLNEKNREICLAQYIQTNLINDKPLSNDDCSLISVYRLQEEQPNDTEEPSKPPCNNMTGEDMTFETEEIDCKDEVFEPNQFKAMINEKLNDILDKITLFIHHECSSRDIIDEKYALEIRLTKQGEKNADSNIFIKILRFFKRKEKRE